MRREFELTATNPTFIADLPFTPSTVIILNNTDKSVYLTVGSLMIPSATFYDREVLPTASGIPSNVALPNNSMQFAGFLPTPTDTTKRVTIIFQGTSDPFSNRRILPPRGGSIPVPSSRGKNAKQYKEFRMKVGEVSQVWELPFRPDMVFILNNTDANLYIHEGSGQIPTSSYYDLTYPPQSYTVLIPHGGWHYGAFLDTPTQKDCWIIFIFGYADEYRALKQLFSDWDWFLPDLVDLGYDEEYIEELFEFEEEITFPPIADCFDECVEGIEECFSQANHSIWENFQTGVCGDFGNFTYYTGAKFINGIGWCPDTENACTCGHPTECGYHARIGMRKLVTNFSCPANVNWKATYEVLKALGGCTVSYTIRRASDNFLLQFSTFGFTANPGTYNFDTNMSGAAISGVDVYLEATIVSETNPCPAMICPQGENVLRWTAYHLCTVT